MAETIRIAIIEDNKNYAVSLEKMLLISEGLSCSVIYRSAEECMDNMYGDELIRTDIILLDLQLPGKSGLMLAPILRQNYPDTGILVLTQNDDYLATLEAIRLGAAGYILKRSSIADIRNAIREVYEGGCVIDPQLSRLVLNALDSTDFPKKNPLTKRERQVLELLAMGYIKKEVADKLNLSYRTITQYSEIIYKKLQVPNTTAAVAAAIRKGLI
ncbi:response regulator transcription factor [Pontiella sulfatireligans]|uniref:Oxygen regulatory protein NreC n=1 Tax=Pontiella sulfatireligans TaxID=2750658 RepID=A0A6C2UGI3_9BACT|nr:response regulator transcription factor [Pontiella sulfatireligans]VGO19322.1 Oxygen regulatory protein NreC [Pontiella sulfatireligans]